jgi:hypothetical protein
MRNKLLLAMLITLPLLSIAQTELKVSTDSRGRSCAGGLGLCRISTSLEMQKNNQESKTTALKLNDSTIQLVFAKSLLSEQELISLCNKTLDKILLTDSIYFIQEDDFIIDSQLLQMLNIDSKLNIVKKGSYPIELFDDNIKVTLPLSKQ